MTDGLLEFTSSNTVYYEYYKLLPTVEGSSQNV